MQQRKKRILWIGEASYLSTGFAVYGKEVLSRLYDTNKYTLAELAVYGGVFDSRRVDLPWTYYGNLPIDDSEREYYLSSHANQWGLWRLEDTLLDFKPDIVFDVRDWWMMEFVERSPFRRMFHWAIMPTIDSAPQREQWLATYLSADAVCTYSEFGRDTLLQESGNLIKFRGIAPPAADYNIWKPAPNKAELRDYMGFEKDVKIVGTVMRNQKRKLYPELINAFKDFLIRYPELGKDTYLYCHTSYPDVGWDIPRLIRESGIGHKILFTYYCRKCKHIFPSFFQDAVQTCPKCKQPTAKMPTPDCGVDNYQLADIVNCFDVYVQYSICEGFGMPQVEAAACGVPVMAVNYSAMESVVKNLKGMPINIQTLFRESETHSYRAYPDNNDFVEKLAHFLSKSPDMRQKMAADTYKLCRQCYDWNKTTKVWENIFDSLPILDEAQTWKQPARIIEPNVMIPNNMGNEQFVRWCIQNIWGEPHRINDYIGLRMIRDLNYGHAMVGNGGIFYDEESQLGSASRYHEFNRDMVISEMNKLAQYRNLWERKRTSPIQDMPPRFIQHAKKERVAQ